MKKLSLITTILTCLFVNSCKKDFDTDKHGSAGLPEQFDRHNSNGNIVLDGEEFPDHFLALTYDDGPDKYTTDLIDYLHSKNILATFFVCKDWSYYGGGSILTGGYYNKLNSSGGNVVSGPPPPFTNNYQITFNSSATVFTPPSLQYYITNGQLLGNHTFAHSGLISSNPNNPFTAAYIRDQLSPVQDDIDLVITNKCYLIRAPYLGWPDSFTSILNGAPTGSPLLKLIPNYIDRNIFGSDWEYPYIGPYFWGTHSSDSRVTDLLHDINTMSNRGIVLLHDRNEFAVGSRFALDMAESYVPILQNSGFVFGAPVMKFSESQDFSTGGDYSDGDGWGSNRGYYGTLRLIDVTGDGKADMCGRGMYGISVAVANGDGFDAKTLWKTDDFNDANGYLPEKYSTTIQFGDVDGDQISDVIIRGADGIMFAKNNGGSFGTTQNLSSLNNNNNYDFSDADGWGSEYYYGSIRLADVNGDGYADVCARSIYGIVVALYDPDPNVLKFQPMSLWKWDDFSDNDGYKPTKYSSTLQFADVSGDGLPDVVIRGPDGIMVAKNLGHGQNEFGRTENWSLSNNGVNDFSDADGWTNFTNYGSIRLADINGDGIADVCGRSQDGVVVAFGSAKLNSTGGFLHKILWPSGGTSYTGSIWDEAKYSTTIQFGDINIGDVATGRGDFRADLVARFINGLVGGYAP